MQPKYFYRLGHVPALGVQEFLTLTRQNSNQIEFDEQYLTSDVELNVNKTGSLVIGGQILQSVQKDSNIGQKWFLDRLESYLRENPVRKLGIAVPKSLNQKVLYSIAKKAGVKQLTIVQDYPNYGYYKKVKNWLLCFGFGDKLIFGKLNSYFDQEYWAKLDSDLPAGDMKRGLINLKLARTLNNLTDCLNIWDPFCGSGRNLISCYDLKERFICSDIDKICQSEVASNFEFLENRVDNLKLQLLDNFTVAAEKVELNEKITNLFEKQNLPLSVVTEGYLGSNTGQKHSTQEITREYSELERIWLGFADKVHEYGFVGEMIICIPFYKNNTELSTQRINNLASKIESMDWHLRRFFNMEPFVVYSRPDSIVGHAVLRFGRKG